MSDDSFLDLSGVHPMQGTGLLSPERFPVLENMSPVLLRILSGACHVMYVAKDVEVVHEGDAPQDMFFVESGKVVVAKHVGGKLKVLRTLGPGDVYGEFGVLRRKARYASVFTAEPSRILRVELSAVAQVLEVDADFRDRLYRIMHHRMLSTFFSSHPVFSQLRPQVAELLASNLTVEFQDRKSRIFSQGDKPVGVYMIVSGNVEVRFVNKSGAEVLLEVRRDNDLIGEVLQKNGTAYAYSAIADSPVDLLLLDKETMDRIRNLDPQFHHRLEAYIEKRSQMTVKRLRENLG